MKPYHEEKGITIYHGDCLEIAPTLGKFDVVLTDPPYGKVRGDFDHVWTNRKAMLVDVDCGPKWSRPRCCRTGLCGGLRGRRWLGG